MSEPGFILNREALVRVAPHIDGCVRHTVTTNEDVDIGGCVFQLAQTKCTTSEEVYIM